MPTLDEMRQGYENLYARAQIFPSKKAALSKVCALVAHGRDRYEEVAAQTGVPWWWIGIIHMRESGCDFKTYLGNGQPLGQETTLVPAGRGPFKTWEDGAIDAIDLRRIKIGSINDIASALYQFEAYNGWGYIVHDVNSPYVWSWTNLYTRGKFVADGKFSSTTIDQQPGCAAMLIQLILEGVIPVLAGKVLDMATSATQTVSNAVVPPAPASGVTVNPIANFATHIITALGAVMMATGILHAGSWVEALLSSQTISGLLASALALLISHLNLLGANSNTLDVLDRVVVALTPTTIATTPATVVGVVQPVDPAPAPSA